MLFPADLYDSSCKNLDAFASCKNKKARLVLFEDVLARSQQHGPRLFQRVNEAMRKSPYHYILLNCDLAKYEREINPDLKHGDPKPNGVDSALPYGEQVFPPLHKCTYALEKRASRVALLEEENKDYAAEAELMQMEDDLEGREDV